MGSLWLVCVVMQRWNSQSIVSCADPFRHYRIDLNNVIKVADFGLSEDIYAKNYYRQSDTEECKVKLPIRWMALESFHDGIFSEKTDVVCLRPNAVRTH